MGKKVRKKSRGFANERQIVTHSLKMDMQPSNPSFESADDGLSVVKDLKSCPHLEKGVNLNKLSSKIGSSESIRCEDCREGAADRRGSRQKGKHGKKKGGASVESKSESKAIWVCLECGKYCCGGVGLPVSPQCHAVRHARQNRHPLVVHFEKPQLCWCFPCNMLIPVEKIEETDETNCVLSDVVKLLKGQSSVDVEGVWCGDGSVTSNIKSGALFPSESNGKGYIVRGLVNLGNTCFFNSIMQNLLAMDRLWDNFLELGAPVGPLTCSLMKLFTETNSESGLKNVINPRSFFGCICSKYPQFRGYQQHDSHELLRCLLDGLNTEELAARKQNDSPRKDRTSTDIATLVDALYGGQISSTVCCNECGHSSTVYEPFLDLSLPVPTKKPSPRKAQHVYQFKKTLPRKKGGKTQETVNRDEVHLPVQSLTTQSPIYESSSPVQPCILVAGEVVASSSASKKLVSVDISNMADEEDLTSSNFLAVQGSEHLLVVGNAAEQISTPLDDFTWLDYVEAETLTGENDFNSQKKDLPMIQDTEDKDDFLNKFPVEASCESSGQVCFLNEEQNLRMSSSGNGWEDEVPVQVQDSEVLLLPYKEECPSTREIRGRDGEASSSVLGCGQESEFDGFGDLFNEPEIVAGPHPRPSSCSEVMEAGFIAGNSIESDPDEVDDTIFSVSVESCFAHFIKSELLSNENALHCENCSKILQHHKLEARKQAKAISKSLINGYETGNHDDIWNAVNSCSAVVRSHGNGEIKNDEIGESSVTCVKSYSELENGQTDELSAILHKREDGVFEINDTNVVEVTSLGFCKTCNEESCNSLIADSCSTQHMIKNVHGRNPLLLDDENNCSSEENRDEEVDSSGVKVKRAATKTVLIYKAPPILTIHLKRFSQDSRGRLSKLNGHVSFKETINLRPYLDPRCIIEEKYEYRLIGIVEHLGTMRGGHYVAYVRGGQRNRGKPDKDNEGSTWYHASDAYVREVSLDEVLRCEAYILFYEQF